MPTLEEERETQSASVVVGDAKGGKYIRLPPDWNRHLGWFKGLLPIAKEWCEGDQMYHVWLLRPGEPMPLCPNNVMVCPCGCEQAFRYNKTEQKALREKILGPRNR